jgi:hypothetical protein
LDIQKVVAKGHLTHKPMTSKRKPKPNKVAPRQVTARAQAGEDPAVGLARTVLQPTVQAAATLGEYNKVWYEPDLCGLIHALTAQTEAANDGDMSRGEAMLIAQAHTLDTIFNHLARRAVNAEYVNNLNSYLKLALRAQSQCRTTWEALATLKHPPVVGYVNQANIAHGPQQVNNVTTPVHRASRARENENLQNELLTANHGETLDTLGTTAASGIDPAMATVGAINRPKDTGG